MAKDGIKVVIDTAELYYDHYCKYLGEPIDREIFKNNDEIPSIQVLKYENVFAECLVYNTLGVSKYENVIGKNLEISMVVDGAFRSTGYILANVLFYCISNEMKIGRGTAISGIENIDKSFVDKYNKSAIYFTEPFSFPEEYSDVCTNDKNERGNILLAFFISQSEYEYFVKYGTDKFEDFLEDNNIDPFNVSRKILI